MNKKITVSIPATSANLGPGYDVLGLALNLAARQAHQADGGVFHDARDDRDGRRHGRGQRAQLGHQRRDNESLHEWLARLAAQAGLEF